ncbi:hypothetical protein AEGHOMDF_3331 [Methylobacterium soli]|nr:hypothetical protein AEGHOMDF_3331 [Methylobacterium soli]
MVRYVVDEYHNRRHEGLGGRTPRNAWAEMAGAYGTIPVPDPHTLRCSFGIPLTRKVTSEGLRVLGVHYQSEEIQQALRDGVEEIKLRINPLDLGRASVWVNGAWREAKCRRRGLVGVSLETWIATAMDLRRRYANAARMSEPVVLASIRAIEQMNKAAIARAGIGAIIPSTETVERAEADLTLGFVLPDDDDEEPSSQHGAPADLFAGVIPVGGQAPDMSEPAPTSRPRTSNPRPVSPLPPDPPVDEDASDDFEIE